jgi:hypothetical protein
MKPMTADELIADIDGPLLRKQRQLVEDLLSGAALPKDIRFTPKQVGILQGLQALLDNLADIAHDRYRKDCLQTPY